MKTNKNVFMFVRNDSEALYENILAAAKTANSGASDDIFSQDIDLVRPVSSGKIPSYTHNIFKNKKYKIYFNDFAKIVRQVRRYTPRYSSPVLKSKLIDISRVNPQYMILRERYTPFGADIVVVNTSNTAISLSEESNLPLYIYGPQIEQTSEGDANVLDLYNKIDDDGKRITDFAFNRSLYGVKSFNINSKYIQSLSQANRLLGWIVKNCSRERMKISLEIFSNPLLELGDKIRIFSDERGYRKSNQKFGNKVFVISEIVRSVGSNGPSMNITLLEIGEK
jgi:hypothetical protein